MADGRPSFAQVRALADAALALPAQYRDDCISSGAAGDVALAHEVRTLLRACDHAEAQDFLAAPATPLAEEAVAEWRRGANASPGAPANTLTNAPPLASGTVIGEQYVIEALAGRGGMANVYRAHDRKHARTVALKVMHTRSSDADGDGAAREIQLTARLQHAGIVPLFDSGILDGRRWFVMPFVEGESLAERLRRTGPLPVREAVRVARSVAEALAYAHREGVVHRDIKPGNILLRDGEPLVTDFGIAHAESSGLDERGFGTPGYMSPEQIAGTRPVDARSDVFAMGCVLFAMLTGASPLAGGSRADVLARTLAGAAPSVRSLRRGVPVAIASLLTRALALDPGARPASATDFAVALDGAARPPSRWLLPVAAILVAALSIGIVTRRPPAAERVARFVLPQGGTSPTGDGGGVLMPDGRTVVFVGGDSMRRQVYIRPIDVLDAEPVPGTEGAVRAFVSPDGRSIGFIDESEALRVVPRTGGVSRRLASVFRFSTADWSPTGPIVFWRFDPRDIAWVSPNGGDPRPLTRLDTARREASHVAPRVLDGGRLVGFTVLHDRGGPVFGAGELAVIPLDTSRALPGAHVRLGVEGSEIIGLVDGWLIYVPPRALTIAAIRFDAGTLRTSGRPVEVLADRTGGINAPVLAADGTLLYTRREMSTLPVIRAPDGREDTLPVPTGSTSMNPRLSADGRRVLLQVSTANGTDAWEVDLVRRTGRFVSRTGRVLSPAWVSEDEFVYLDWANSGAIWRQRPDTADAGRRLFESLGALAPQVVPTRGLVVFQRMIDGIWSIWSGPIDGEGPQRLLVQRTGHAFLPSVSPNGRWLAYVRGDSGRLSVWLRRLVDDGAANDIRVSKGSASEPRWTPEGTRLVMRSLGRIVAAEILLPQESTTAPRIGRITDLGADDYTGQMPHTNFDVLPGGRGLVTVRSRRDRPRSVVVLDWRSELRHRLRAAQK